MRKLRKDSSLGGEAVRLTISKVITLCITMGTSMLLSRFRTFEEYGTYSQLLLVVSLFTTLFMLGLPSSINYFLARAETRTEQQRFLSVYYTLSTLLSVLLGAVLVCAIPLIEAYFHNPLIRTFYYFLAVYPWTNIISASIENVLVVFKQTRFLMIYRIAHSAAILGAVVAVQCLGYGFNTYLKVFVAINALFAISVYVIAFSLSGGIRPSLDGKMIRSVFAFSIPIGLATVVGTLNAEMDKLMIGYLMDTEQMAIYSNAARELPFAIVASSITAVLLPQLTRMIKNDNKQGAVALWGSATELAFMIIALIVAGVFTYAEEIMTILYSAKYLPGVQVFRVYTLNLLLRCTYFGMVLNACGETKKIFFCSILSLVLNMILNPVFYWLFGMIGPAIATFLAILIIQLVQLRMTSRKVSIHFSRIFPWKRLGIILLINGGFALVFGGLKRILPVEAFAGEVIESVVLGIIWAAVYFFLMRKQLLSSWHELNHGGDQS